MCKRGRREIPLWQEDAVPMETVRWLKQNQDSDGVAGGPEEGRASRSEPSLRKV